MTVNETTQPQAYPAGGHYPAGWVSAAEHERVERERVALELTEEQEVAERAAREQAIAERLAERRGVQKAVEPEPEAAAKPEAAE